MAGGAAEMVFRCVFEGSITMQDCLVERRPYHRNCNCALHNLKGSVCSSAACSQTRNNISFPKKEAWTDCSMSMSASKLISSQSSLPDHGSSIRSRQNFVNAALHVTHAN